mgnify:CR=1 FL=1
MTIRWRNRGVARAYFDYQLVVRLEGAGQAEVRVPAGNTGWLPGDKTWDETYSLPIPGTLPPGDYQLKIKLYSPQTQRDVKLPLKADRTDRNGFYSIGKVVVAAPGG